MEDNLTRREISGKRDPFFKEWLKTTLNLNIDEIAVNDNDLYFSQWIRDKLPDSSLGFKVSDLDFILCNLTTKKIILIEVGQYNKIVYHWQHEVFNVLHRALLRGIEKDWQYLGFHFIKFECHDFDDGNVYFDNEQVDERVIIYRLSF